MLSFQTKRKHACRVVLLLMVVLPVVAFSIYRIVSFNLVGAIDYTMPAGFNDQVFYNCVVNQFKSAFPSEAVPDDGLTDTQLAQMTSLNCNNNTSTTKITDVTGLEKMTELTYIDLRYNEIDSIDLSNNTKLTQIDLNSNNLSDLDISNNLLIHTINANDNNLTTLDLSNKPSLRALSFNNNQLSSLVLTNDTALTTLSVYSNHLSSLDILTNTALTSVNLDYNDFTALDFTGSPNLKSIRVSSNTYLASLDVTGLTKLETLYAVFDSLSELDISTNVALKNVELGENELTSFDASNNLLLKTLKVDENQITNLILPDTTTLTVLHVNNNQLASLDVSQYTGLTSLLVHHNILSSLDVSNNTNLITLEINNNSISEIDVSNSPSLVSFKSDNIPVRADVSVASPKEPTTFSFENLRFLSVLQNVTNTSSYTYNNSSKILTIVGDGIVGSVPISSSIPAYRYSIELPVFVAFDANGGSGTSRAITCYVGDSDCDAVVPADEPTREYYHFIGWSENKDASTASYKSGDNITIDGYKTLYALWAPVRKLNYNVNGGNGVYSEQTCYTENTEQTNCNIGISNTVPTRDGYHFLGWATSADAKSASYNAGGQILMSGNTTIYAVWAPIYTLSFEIGDGEGEFDEITCHSNTTINAGCEIDIPDDEPTLEGHEFVGWATTEDTTEMEYEPGDKITINSDTILYALWNEIIPEEPEEEPLPVPDTGVATGKTNGTISIINSTILIVVSVLMVLLVSGFVLRKSRSKKKIDFDPVS